MAISSVGATAEIVSPKATPAAAEHVSNRHCPPKTPGGSHHSLTMPPIRLRTNRYWARASS